MKHLLKLAVRVNYEPIIAAQVTYSFPTNSVARLEMLFRRWM